MEYTWLVIVSTKTRTKTTKYDTQYKSFCSQELALVWLEVQGCEVSNRFDYKTEIPVDILFLFLNKKEKTVFSLIKLKMIDEV